MVVFDPAKEYILENERVRLAPLSAADIKVLAPFSLNEPDLWTYSLQQGGGIENLKQYIQTALNERAAGKSYAFSVYDKHVSAYAGSTRFYDFQPVHNTIQLGFTWYGKAFQGTGLNKQCKFLMLEFAFETIGFDRVEFRADANNTRSIAAMKSIGCTPEGVLRNNCKSLTGRRSSIVLSILKEEWTNSVKKSLQQKIRREQNRSTK